MSTTKVGCNGATPASQQQPCLTCDLPAFCRNSYYRGKLLTERDFTDEQRYSMNKLRLHALALHGWGVVCGLVAKPHPYCKDKRLVVCAGLAIDECGREIRMLADDYVPLPQPPPAPPKPKVPPPTLPPQPAPTPEAAAAKQSSPSVAAGAAPGAAPSALPCTDEDEYDHPKPDEGCDEKPAPKDYYLYICYAECETEFAPAPFDDCSCTTSSQKPNRVCESYQLQFTEQKPTWWDKAKGDPCEPDDCSDYYFKARECCRETNCCPCVPLAVVCNYVPGEELKAEQIDNWGPRRQLASVDTLDQVVRCILGKLPPSHLTKIEDINWEHNCRILCREFVEEYVGTPEHPRGFRIGFSDRVHSAAIDVRSFQAMVVFHPESHSDPRHMQVAPARVERDADETNWCRLQIDPAYARKNLDGRSFDLFLTLKCDVIRDRHGHAVDGNFIGGRLPTGDSIQGGTFESWIRVRPRSHSIEAGRRS